MVVVRNVFRVKFGMAREAVALMKKGRAIEKRDVWCRVFQPRTHQCYRPALHAGPGNNRRKVSVYAIALASLGVLMVSTPDVALSQGAPSGAAPRTLAVAVAHADDEGPVAPILARYAREGVQVYLIIASDGVTGVGQQGHIPRPDVTVQGDELVRQRAEEARCATQALAIQPPILLGFPDGKLGD